MIRLRWAVWVIVALVAALLGLFAYQLSQPKDEFIHSAMIGKPIPEFDLRAAIPERPGLSRADLADGQPKLVNIFASWCVPCAAEAPQLAELESNGANIVGVAIRDRPEDLTAFLNAYGNPFSRIGADDISAVQLSIGSSGVPETFVVDGEGIVRYQHIGDIRERDVPILLDELRKAAS
ncbi:cytochrome c biogenesis protein CcmG/thiol:disulfide interchange protein DsbE [Altererythrobacter atlanticus]|uniref:Thiol:disulfide interchange protein DsbE n=1 Tax=Croceibacterium atlanticum TaxID=1267766 RepID=A0A0F7KRM5_9SPHN|nr:DsbE family thiol:disulfide interchange protein [Croceibacterium atlanticum]AKH41872.1 Thiol:disulfide interchange protein DsbE [Croceibacterium atlanticum]MBB5733565.1 cytochrome c biogenesis protein CcmG/thiol:disulfide interchange protein DsbE [Croceibacterium atlanticum]